MNKQGIIKSVSTIFPTEWHSATKFGVNPVKFALRNILFNRVNQIGHDKIAFVLMPVLKPAQKIQFGFLLRRASP